MRNLRLHNAMCPIALLLGGLATPALAQEPRECSTVAGAVGVADEASEGVFIRGPLPPTTPQIAPAGPEQPPPDPADVPQPNLQAEDRMLALSPTAPAGTYIARYTLDLPNIDSTDGYLDAAIYVQDDDLAEDRVILKLYRGGSYVASLDSNRPSQSGQGFAEGVFARRGAEFTLVDLSANDPVLYDSFYIEVQLITNRSPDIGPAVPISDEVRGPALGYVSVCLR